MPGNREFDYLIVGGGLAAASAVDGILETDPDGSVLVLTEEAEPPYQRPPLSKEFLQYADVPRSLLYVKPDGWFDGQERVCLEVHQRVLVLDPSAMNVTTARGNVFAAPRILLATGGRARRLNAPGVDLPGVFTLRTVEDSEAIREASCAAGRAVFVGAGFIGMEVAASLTVHGVNSVVVEAAERVWPRILPPELSAWMREFFEARGVSFRLETCVERFAGAPRLEEVVAGGEHIPCDFAVVGVGLRPCVSLAADAGLAVDDGVCVDAYGETSHPDIYAAGDVARFPDPVFGGSARVEHWEHAREHGRSVGRNMAGSRERYELLSHFFSRVFDLSIDALGRTGDVDLTVLRGTPGDGPCVAVCVIDDRVSGTVLLNASQELETARRLVRATPRLADLGPDLDNEARSLGSLAELAEQVNSENSGEGAR